VAIYKYVSDAIDIIATERTVNPLERVVDWVVDGNATGDAKPRFTGWMDFRAARVRRAWFRLRARRREAIENDFNVWRGGGTGERWRKELMETP
jgi:hypothetical protein